jgi:flagellar hook-length control protein FliK
MTIVLPSAAPVHQSAHAGGAGARSEPAVPAESESFGQVLSRSLGAVTEPAEPQLQARSRGPAARRRDETDKGEPADASALALVLIAVESRAASAMPAGSVAPGGAAVDPASPAAAVAASRAAAQPLTADAATELPPGATAPAAGVAATDLELVGSAPRGDVGQALTGPAPAALAAAAHASANGLAGPPAASVAAGTARTDRADDARALLPADEPQRAGSAGDTGVRPALLSASSDDSGSSPRPRSNASPAPAATPPQVTVSVQPVASASSDQPLQADAATPNPVPAVAPPPPSATGVADAPAAAPAAVSGSVAPEVGSRAWGPALGHEVVKLAHGGQHMAQLQLNPPGLGPLKVILAVSDQQAQAVFVSSHPAVRAAVEAALPQLRAALADNGISLGQASVGADSQQQAGGFSQGQAGQPGPRRHTANGDGGAPSPFLSDAQFPAVPAARSHLNAVDIFA